LLQVLNEVLDLSKIDAGRMDVAHAEFHLQSLVREIAVLFQPLCAEKRIAISADGLDSGPTRPVLGDAVKLRQVLINLVGNAVKFTEAGVVTLRLLAQGDSHWRFEVEDTGPGIPPLTRDVVFEPFQQGVNGNGKGGTGLGLAIARRQVELMGGTLALECGQESGALFHFTLTLPSAGSSTAIGGMPIGFGGVSSLAIDLGPVGLPEPLAAGLLRAAELHSATGVRSCLDELAGLGPNGCRIASHLRDLLAAYDMEAIQAIVCRLSVGTAAGS
jgi:hypothetical protein